MATKQLNDTSELPDAINTDGDEAVGTTNDARIAMLERINDANDASDSDQYENVNDDGTTSPFVVEQADGTKEPLTDEAVAEEIIDHDAPKTFKLKVNGKEIELTQDELIIRAQKVEAADAYLAEAVRLKKEAEQQQPAKQQLPDPDAAARQEEEERALVRAIQMGTEDEAMAAIRTLKTGPSLTKDDLARTVDERLTFKEAAKRFETDFSDVMSNPELRKMALRRDQELLNAGDARSYWERFEAVGKEIRTWRDEFLKTYQPNDKPEVETKLQRKAAAAPVPVSASKKAPAPVAEEDKEESLSDVIANIAKARGGAQWTRA